jgi:hypothetical protein
MYYVKNTRGTIILLQVKNDMTAQDSPAQDQKTTQQRNSVEQRNKKQPIFTNIQYSTMNNSQDRD